MSIFTIRINPIMGKKEWVAKPEHYDFYQEVARSAYADMLHDKERNEKYYKAIKKAIQTIKNQGRPAKVLDIGTGTGLLSMMAASAGADSVTACEMFRPVAKCAECVIKQNNFEDKINVILKNSNELTVGKDGDLKEKANILVAEVFDTELIGEGALKTFHHAINNLLEPDSIVVPSSALVYAQIVDSTLISNWNKLQPISINENQLIFPPTNITACPGSAAVHDLQMSELEENTFKFITEAICVFEFDFTGKKSIEMNETFIKQISVTENGKCEIVFMWWILNMDMTGEIVLNNGPKWAQENFTQVQWRDHWMQAIYYLPEIVTVSKGDKITLTAYHDEYSLWFSIPKSNNNKTVESPACKCLVHVSDPHSRIGMKNDAKRNNLFIKMLKQCITPDKVCLCISDGSLLPLIAAKLGAKKVFTVESNHYHQTMVESYIATNQESDKIKVIKKEPVEVTLQDVEGEKIDLLLTEPYFSSCLHPWDLLYFWHIRTVLNPILSPDVTVMPQKGTLKAVVVDFDHLWKIRAPVKNAEGFNLFAFDEMIQKAISITDSTIEPHPLWEYPSKALSKPFNLFTLDFTKKTPQTSIEVSGKEKIIGSGTCNGVAIWVDYSFLDMEISTGPIHTIIPGTYTSWYMYCQQGVHFLHPPISFQGDSAMNLKYKLTLDLQTGDTSFNFCVEDD